MSSCIQRTRTRRVTRKMRVLGGTCAAGPTIAVGVEQACGGRQRESFPSRIRAIKGSGRSGSRSRGPRTLGPRRPRTRSRRAHSGALRRALAPADPQGEERLGAPRRNVPSPLRGSTRTRGDCAAARHSRPAVESDSGVGPALSRGRRGRLCPTKRVSGPFTRQPNDLLGRPETSGGTARSSDPMRQR